MGTKVTAGTLDLANLARSVSEFMDQIPEGGTVHIFRCDWCGETWWSRRGPVGGACEPCRQRRLFVEILFPRLMAADDIDVIEPASRDRPGRARLHRARVGLAGGLAARPVLSRSGARIGFVDDEAAMEPPYTNVYRLEGKNGQV